MQKYGLLANLEESAQKQSRCLVCDQAAGYHWSDYSGEGCCLACGTPYQLKWGELDEGETYPRINVREEAIPMLRRYWVETKQQNGLGTFMSLGQYPEVVAGRLAMSEWWRKNKQEYPECHDRRR